MDGSEQTRRQQILDAALRVFAREGYHKASIRHIALEAGLKSPPLLYWYFKDKNELFKVDTNILLGCRILKFYLDMERGDLVQGLARYNGSVGRRWYADRVIDRLRTKWFRQ